MLAVRDGLSAREQRLEREPRTDPRLAIVGASYTAGVGPGVPSRSWAAVLARTLRWDSVIRTDDAIVMAARAADPDAIIMDPLTGRWKFAHFDGSGLHPTATGDGEIAQKVGAILQAHGIAADSSATAVPLICQVSIGVGGDAGGRGTPRDA